MNIELIIKENAGLIWKIAKMFYNAPKQDLYQAGVLGLIKAYQNYQKNGDTKFSTYAYNYIYGEMYNVATNSLIKESKDLRKLIKKIEYGKNKLAQDLLREPTNEELAEYLELDLNVVEWALMNVNNIISIDEKLDGERSLHEVIKSEEEVSVDDKILLDECIKSLKDLEKDIINARYFEELTQSETAKKLGITQVMVSRYEQRSLKKMRNYMYM